MKKVNLAHEPAADDALKCKISINFKIIGDFLIYLCIMLK